MSTLPSLEADCAQCAALCCVAFSFVSGQGFGSDKEADVPCPNLSGHQCKIYGTRAAKGWGACDHYDCNGAGPYVTQELFDGASWQADPALLPAMTRAMRDIRPFFEGLKLIELAETRVPGADYAGLRATLWPEPWTLDRLAASPAQPRFDAIRRKLRDILSNATSG